MGAAIAILSKRDENVTPKAVKMLNVLRHRGAEAYGLSDGRKIIITKSLEEMDSVGMKSNIVLGCNFKRILPDDAPQLTEISDFNFLFEGRIFPPNDKSEVADLIKRSGDDAGEAAKNIISMLNGSFIFVVLERDGKLIVGRDPVGAVPLYIGENEHVYALASERKALWSIGIEENRIKSFPPGNLAKIYGEGMTLVPVKTIERTMMESLEERDIVDRLHDLLLNSIKRRTADVKKVSIAFSGGLDSSIIAALVKKIGIEALLICVGIEGSRELEHAERMAENIGLPFKAEVYAQDHVERDLREVLWLIESANTLRVSIGIPIFWVAKASSKIGYRILLSGQGSDEIFAGYHKYLRDYEKLKGKIEDLLYRDALSLYETSLEQDEKICSFHGVEVRFPYADYDLMSFALGLPAALKIESETDPLRKRILRRLAENMCLPPEVYLKPKKAIQYGTGVSKTLKKLGKRMGLDMRSFISQLFEEVKQTG
jgi:asparagine synthase (glutamine-hydrolysing)